MEDGHYTTFLEVVSCIPDSVGSVCFHLWESFGVSSDAIWQAPWKHTGPMSFLIYIKDLPLSTSHSSMQLMVDDTKYLKRINSPMDNVHLQCDLDAHYV